VGKEVWLCVEEAGGQSGQPWTYKFRRKFVEDKPDAEPAERSVQAERGVYEPGKHYDEELNPVPGWDHKEP
jgi:hypothetical protein